MIDRKALKQNAREAMKAARPHPAWVTLVVLVILLVTQVLSLAVSGELELYRVLWQSAMAGEFDSIANAMLNGGVSVRASTGLVPWFLGLALDLMTMVVSMGYSLYALRVHRRENPGVGDVFDAFGSFVRVVVLSFLRGLILSALSGIYVFAAAFVGTFIDPVAAAFVCMPALIPMILASYAYRLADFLVFDHPDYSAIQCLALSRMAMQGRKWELFKLDLSLLGWILLEILPVAVLWVRPYVSVVNAGFYDEVIPAFWEKVKNRSFPAAPVNRGPADWSVPGESREEDEDRDPEGPDDEDHWFDR